MTEYLIITGMSGAGRSTAAAALEDVGWYVIDNMPPSLLPQAAETFSQGPGGPDRVAVVTGRGGAPVQVAALLEAVDQLVGAGDRVRILYLDAPLDVLVHRYEGTRRRHPIAGAGVEEAIVDERQLLEPLRDRADVVVDTGQLNVNQLRSRTISLFGGADGEEMRTTVVSFGYTHGLPLDADLVFDCRFLPNPHWVEQLRPFSGLDQPVRDYVLGQKDTAVFLDLLDQLLAALLPAFVAEGKSYLTIAMGCTGGRHRSVVLADEVSRRLVAHGAHPSVFHRDVDR